MTANGEVVRLPITSVAKPTKLASPFQLRCCTIVNKPLVERALGPVPQEENLLFVEQAGKPVKREWCKM
ncbi:hypothetical protein QUA56_12090 [Microcoleus sp. N3A4]|uniref:hypothetical protein n=1 Tax=Microcoleus sp. N3A4 TaxID=3055379 RepID=UPI002FCF8AF8